MRAGKGKALALAGVPESMAQQMMAGEWVKAPLGVLGGKGGGKATVAQGQGPHLDKVPEALRAAEDYAAARM